MQCPQDWYYNTVAHNNAHPNYADFQNAIRNKDPAFYITPITDPSNDPRCTLDIYNPNVSYDCEIDFYRLCQGGNPGGWTTKMLNSKAKFSDTPSNGSIQYNVTPWSVQCIPNQPTMTDAMIKQCCSKPPTQNGTCAIQYCPSGTGCISGMSRICSVLDENGNWDPSCDAYFSQENSQTTLAFQQLMTAQLGNGKIYDVNNPFNKYASTYCPMLPGACDEVLQSYCSNVERGELVFDPTLLNLCGCFMKPDNNHYPFFNKQVPVSCDPVCVIASAQQSSGGQLARCEKTVCIIDDVSFNIVNSSGGKITFDQICGSSSTGNDARGQCFIDGVSINTINSSLAGVTIGQMCGQCYAPGATAENPTTIPCGGSGPTSIKKWVVLIIIFTFIIFLIFSGVVFFLYHRGTISGKTFTILLMSSVILLLAILVASYFFYQGAASGGGPLPPSALPQTINSVSGIKTYVSGGKWVISWETPQSNITTPDPEPIEYSIQLYTTSLKSIGNPYQGLQDNFVILSGVPPGDYVAQIIAYSGAVLSPVASYPFTLYGSPIFKNLAITTSNSKAIIATGTVVVPPELLNMTATIQIWVPPNDANINPTRPSFTFQCRTEIDNNGTVTAVFDMNDLLIAQSIKYAGSYYCPGGNSRKLNILPKAQWISMDAIQTSSYQAAPFVLPNASNIASVTKMWIYDPVTQFISSANDQATKWSMNSDSGGKQFLVSGNVPDNYFKLNIMERFPSGVFFPTPYQALQPQSAIFKYNAIYQTVPTANMPCSAWNLYALTNPVFLPTLNLKGYQYSISVVVTNEVGPTTASTPISIW
jgi:hypothetical protein